VVFALQTTRTTLGTIPLVPPRTSPDPWLKKVGARVRAARQERGRTQEDVAGAIEMDRVHYNRLELGRANISLIALRRIARTLRVPPRDLLPSD
jgi:DNA-binding XRE family transcriptional regulator